MPRQPQITAGEAQSSRPWLFGLLPFLVWIIPLVGLVAWVYIPGAIEVRSLSAPEIETVIAGERLTDRRTSVVASVTTSASPQVKSATGGLVTSVFVVPGDDVESGREIIGVDGRLVLAYQGDGPFYRPLQAGDKGTDVGWLNRYLKGLGYDVDPDSTFFSWATTVAVRALQERIHTERDGVFRPDYVAFVPSDGGRVASVTIRVNDTVGGGSVIYDSNPGLTSVSLSPSEETQSLDDLLGQSWSLEVGDTQLAIGSSELTDEEVQAFAELLGTSEMSIVAADDGKQFVRGLFVKLANPEQFASVPGSAIWVGDSACVFEATDGGFIAHSLIDPPQASSEIGQVLVDADLIGHRVVVNASDLPAQSKSQCD